VSYIFSSVFCAWSINLFIIYYFVCLLIYLFPDNIERKFFDVLFS
jgi:hypothetical protein